MLYKSIQKNVKKHFVILVKLCIFLKKIRRMCNNLNARDGVHVGYKKQNSVWKKFDGSEISDQFVIDWIDSYGSRGKYMSLECWREKPEQFGQLFDTLKDKRFICQYV